MGKLVDGFVGCLNIVQMMFSGYFDGLVNLFEDFKEIFLGQGGIDLVQNIVFFIMLVCMMCDQGISVEQFGKLFQLLFFLGGLSGGWG